LLEHRLIKASAGVRVGEPCARHVALALPEVADLAAKQQCVSSSVRSAVHDSVHKLQLVLVQSVELAEKVRCNVIALSPHDLLYRRHVRLLYSERQLASPVAMTQDALKVAIVDTRTTELDATGVSGEAEVAARPVHRPLHACMAAGEFRPASQSSSSNETAPPATEEPLTGREKLQLGHAAEECPDFRPANQRSELAVFKRPRLDAGGGGASWAPLPCDLPGDPVEPLEARRRLRLLLRSGAPAASVRPLMLRLDWRRLLDVGGLAARLAAPPAACRRPRRANAHFERRSIAGGAGDLRRPGGQQPQLHIRCLECGSRFHAECARLLAAVESVADAALDNFYCDACLLSC
uniref:PHD domain-containing protein n=1 Tax=Macrostomum lignano TaxID=282301 RepID=A0A1I8J3Y3_9PLAT